MVRIPAFLTPFALALLFAAAFAPSARAEAERCPKMVAQAPPRLIPAAFKASALDPNQVSLTYIGHSTFLIETAGGVTVATDYNDYVRPDIVPRVATMNRAHSTHYSLNPDPGIEHVLKGWNEDRTPVHTTFRSAICGSAACRPIFATGRAARSRTAIPSSFSAPRTCASPISAISTTR